MNDVPAPGESEQEEVIKPDVPAHTYSRVPGEPEKPPYLVNESMQEPMQDEEDDDDLPIGPMVVRDSGGWAYRVMEDGGIKVIAAPPGSKALGRILPPGSKYHDAIKADTNLRTRMSQEAREALGVVSESSFGGHTEAKDDAPAFGAGGMNSALRAADRIGGRLDDLNKSGKG
jgi:hypothetical protein